MENKKLLFLGTMIEIKDDFSLGLSIYRKKTHTDKYLHFNSNHPSAHKISVMDSLFRIAINTCDKEKLFEELNHIKYVLKLNNYPHAVIERRLEHIKSTPSRPKENQDPIKRVALPYMGNSTIQIARAIRSLSDFDVCYIPVNKISTLLSNNKQRTTDKVGVYKFPCNSCPKIYVGETGRNLPIRIREQLADIRNKKARQYHIFTSETIPLIPSRRTQQPSLKLKDKLNKDASKNHCT